MKFLMLLAWLVGGEPKSEALLFDSEAICMKFGEARIKRLQELHPDIKFLHGECIETELQES